MAPARRARPTHGLFETRLAQVDAVLHNQDNREHDLLDSDDYYQFEGGLAATVKQLTGRKRRGLSQRPFAARDARASARLDEEIARVVRARVVNPKWIAGVMRHGYKGAFEMAATVDYLFAFAATTDCVADHHFDVVFDAYLGDDAVRDFIAAPQSGRAARDRRAPARGAGARPVEAALQRRPCRASSDWAEPSRMTTRAAS